MGNRSHVLAFVATVSAPCDAHDVRGKPQSTNMVAKIKKVKNSSRYFENNINWGTKFAELSSQLVKSD